MTYQYIHKYAQPSSHTPSQPLSSQLAISQPFNQAGGPQSGVALRILGVAPPVGEKGVALKVGETAASHLTPLHAPLARIMRHVTGPNE